jgi:2,4-dienoyl-CoA reductase-like NADH-dependent reductase (Old Yellow Enzyme family)
MKQLFEENTINGMKLKNRLIRSATCEGMSDPHGHPSSKHFDLYEKLARGGVGLIITGFSTVSKDGGPASSRMGFAMHDENIVNSLKPLTEHVHKHGSKIAVQLAHGGRESKRSSTGLQPIAPSPIKKKMASEIPKEMSRSDIERITDDFAQAALRAKESGFDAVQIHAAHGFLLSQYLSPATNRRKDKWGGSPENRVRILQKIHDKCRKLVGKDYPLLIKINFSDMEKGGLAPEIGLKQAELISKMGYDAIEVSSGNFDDGLSNLRGNFPVEILVEDFKLFDKKPFVKFLMNRFGKKLIKTTPYSQSYNREAAKRLKRFTSVPIMLVGGNDSAAVIDDIIESGDADYVSLCRRLIMDPALPSKLKAGSTTESRCIQCNHCLFYTAVGPLKCYHGKRIVM